MPIETFTIQQFEEALPTHRVTHKPLWTRSTKPNKEAIYLIPVIPGYATIKIQSSIDLRTGISASLGEDSIRANVIDPVTDAYLCQKVQRWVCRTRNWRNNLRDVLKQLYVIASALGPCPKCDRDHKCATGIYRVKDGPNAGCYYLRCVGRHGFLGWISPASNVGKVLIQESPDNQEHEKSKAKAKAKTTTVTTPTATTPTVTRKAKTTKTHAH